MCAWAGEQVRQAVQHTAHIHTLTSSDWSGTRARNCRTPSPVISPYVAEPPVASTSAASLLARLCWQVHSSVSERITRASFPIKQVCGVKEGTVRCKVTVAQAKAPCPT